MRSVSIVYYSGWGHTKKQAEAVAEGVKKGGATVELFAIDKEGSWAENLWDKLATSDAILFGSPTYMGGPAWQFKKFADASSKPWGAQAWKDKLAGGFSNSATINGDKFNTITYMVTLAMQHGMLWAGTGLLPANKKASQRNDVNWLGGFTGALAQSPSDASAEEGPLPGDLETARIYGERIATLLKR